MRRSVIHIFPACCSSSFPEGLDGSHHDIVVSSHFPTSAFLRSRIHALNYGVLVVFAIIISLSWAVASFAVADSISLKFEDNPINMESLADDPAILLAIHAAALHCKINFQWDPVQEEMILSKNGAEARLVLGNHHALVTGQALPVLRPLSKPPAMLRGTVVLPPQDIALLLECLLPSMTVSWDEAKSTIEVSKKSPVASRSASGFELRTIVIDPGHGGHDPGAVRRGVQEKQIVLDIAQRLAKLIESGSNWRVVLTRNSDTFIKLHHRTQMASQYPADSTLFVSIHCNSARSSLGYGMETFVFDMKATDAESADLAKRENADEEMDLAYILNHCYHVGNEPYSLEAARTIQSSLVRRLDLKNRGVKRAPFYVLTGTKMPSVLAEVGFVSNFYDRKKLQSASFRQSAAEALFDAIKEFDKVTVKSLAKADIN